MAELGTYYITIMPEMSQFTGEVKKALSTAGNQGGKSFSTSFANIVKGSAIGTALGGLASKAGNAIMSGLDTGIRRLDTLKNYPRVLESLGYSSDAAAKSIKTITDHLDGLPSSTQDLVALTQSIADSTGDLDLATTAALGLALRASGAGLRVFIGQFMKSGDSSELAALGRLQSVTAEAFGSGLGLLLGREATREDAACARAGVERLLEVMGAYDVVIADEINCALRFGLLKEGDLLRLIDARPASTELVFTGRGASPAILARADLVTEMRAVKHYYRDKGLPARVGIEK